MPSKLVESGPRRLLYGTIVVETGQVFVVVVAVAVVAVAVVAGRAGTVVETGPVVAVVVAAVAGVPSLAERKEWGLSLEPFHWSWNRRGPCTERLLLLLWWWWWWNADQQYIIGNDGVQIAEVALEDDTTFTCRARVQTTGQLEDRRIRVNVFIPPRFAAEPADASVVEGESAVFQCQSEGKPSPVYTWVDRNNQNLHGRDRYVHHALIFFSNFMMYFLFISFQ